MCSWPFKSTLLMMNLPSGSRFLNTLTKNHKSLSINRERNLFLSEEYVRIQDAIPQRLLLTFFCFSFTLNYGESLYH